VPLRKWLQLIDWAVRRLIVNADDFGLTRGVNRAVMELHDRRVLTSATLMVKAPATADAIALAAANPSLGVGCHVVLVDGEPLRNASDIPSLVDKQTGMFHATLGSFVRALLRGRIRAEEIEGEAAAQIGMLQQSGLRLTHIDTHKHTHMFPAILRPVLRAARTAGIRAVRNPFEPAWSRHATPAAPLTRRMQVGLLHRLEPSFRRTVAEEGFSTPDGALGIIATGSLDEAAVSSLLQHMPEGTWELVTHPGYNDAELARAHTRLKESREIERRVLEVIANAPDIEQVNFSALSPEQR
jgi:hopanoid biosynthesis associated protein HpnK